MIFSKSQQIALSFIFFLGLLLRVVNIAHESLWFDEVVSLAFTTYSYTDLFSGNRYDPGNPWGYFLLLKAWFELTGLSGYGSRWLACLSYPLTLAATYLLAKKLSGADQRSTLLALILVAFSPPLIFLDREARVYTLFIPLMTYGLLLFFKICEDHLDWKRWLLWVLIMCLGMTLHYYTILIFIIQGIYLVIIYRNQLIAIATRLVLSSILIIISFAHYLPTFILQLEHGGDRYSFTWIYHLIFFPSYSLFGRTIVWKQEGILWVGLLVGVTLILLLPLFFKIIQNREKFKRSGSFLIATVSFLILYSLYSPSISVRYLAWLIPLILIMVAMAWNAIKHRRFKFASAIGITAMMLFSIWNIHNTKFKVDWVGLYAELEKYPSKDLVVVGHQMCEYVFRNFYQKRLNLQQEPYWTFPGAWETRKGSYQDFTEKIEGEKRFYFVKSSHPVNPPKYQQAMNKLEGTISMELLWKSRWLELYRCTRK